MHDILNSIKVRSTTQISYVNTPIASAIANSRANIKKIFYRGQGGRFPNTILFSQNTLGREDIIAIGHSHKKEINIKPD